MEIHGLILTNREADVLYRAHTSPFTAKSDFSRSHANEIAYLCSGGYLYYHNGLWLITVKGLTTLNEYDEPIPSAVRGLMGAMEQ